MAEDQLLRYVREDFCRKELIPNVDGGNMQYYFNAFRDTDQSSLRSLGVPERSASPSCTEQIVLENYLPGGFFTSNSLDQVGVVRIAAFEPPAIECSNSTQQKLEVGAAAQNLAGDHHNSSFRIGSRVSLNSQQVHQILFEDHPQDDRDQPNSDSDIHPSRINSVASTSDCKSTSNVVEMQAACREIKPKTWRGCSPAALMLQLQGPSSAAPSAFKFSNFDHRPNNINFDHQPVNITSTGNNTQSATQLQQQLKHMPSMSAPSRPNPLYTQPRVSINPHHSYSNAERDSSFQPQMCTKGAGDHNNTSMMMSWHFPDHQQQTTLRGATESCHPRPRGATSSECELNVDQSFTANSHVTLAGSGWPDGRTGASLRDHIKLGCAGTSAAAGRVDNSSGNNSWSSCTSPSPSSNDQNEEVGPNNITSRVDQMWDMKPNPLQNFPTSVLSEFQRRRKKPKGSVTHHVGGGGITEYGFLSAGNNLGDQYHHEKRKRSLQEKILHLILQPDTLSSKECQIQVLDDTIESLKNLRRRLNDPTCSSLQLQMGMGCLDATEKNCNESAATADSSKLAGVDGSSALLQLEKLELDTEGVDFSEPHLSVDNINVPQIEVRMMEEHAVMVKLDARDRPGLFNDIMMVLKNLGLEIQHGNIRTTKGERQDVFAVKMQLPNCSIDTQTTTRIANALFNVISSTT